MNVDTPPSECMVCAAVGDHNTDIVVRIGYACSRDSNIVVYGYCERHAYGEMEFGSRGAVYLAQHHQVLCGASTARTIIRSMTTSSNQP